MFHWKPPCLLFVLEHLQTGCSKSPSAHFTALPMLVSFFPSYIFLCKFAQVWACVTAADDRQTAGRHEKPGEAEQRWGTGWGTARSPTAGLLVNIPDLHLRLVVTLHHLRGEVLQAEGRLQGGPHSVQIGAQSRCLRRRGTRWMSGHNTEMMLLVVWIRVHARYSSHCSWGGGGGGGGADSTCRVRLSGQCDVCRDVTH